MRFRITPPIEVALALLAGGSKGDLSTGGLFADVRYRFFAENVWNFYALAGIGLVSAGSKNGSDAEKKGRGSLRLGVGGERRFGHFAVFAELCAIGVGQNKDVGAQTTQQPVDYEWQQLHGKQLFDRMAQFANEKRTGVFIATDGERERAILFVSGGILSCASDDPGMLLSERLVADGLIDRAMRARALDVVEETHLSFGRVLLLMDAITEEELLAALRRKIDEEIEAIASWGAWSAEGRWVWWWKDRIDRGFVDSFNRAVGKR